MSIEQAKSFLAKAQADGALKERLTNLMAAGDAAGLVGLGQEAGFTFAASDIKEAMSSGELSVDELMAASGGTGGNWSSLDTTPVRHSCA